MAKRLVVVGGVAGGASAAAKARRVDPNLEIEVFEKGEYVSYGACGLPYYIGRVIEKKEKLIVRTPAQFEEQGIKIRLRREVVELDLRQRKVKVINLEDGKEEARPFDSLVIATGALPVRPDIPGVDLKGVYVLRTFSQGVRIREDLESGRVKRVVILGGGFIGTEMAEAFRNWGLEVFMVKASSKVLRDFDDVASQAAKEALERHGVTILTGCRVEAIVGGEWVEYVLVDGERLGADLVLISKGIKPNVSLAVGAGIEIGPYGGIATDERAQTSVEGIFAAGDCAETIHFVTGEPYYKPLGTTANKMGRVAGTNAAGGSAVFKGVVGTSVIKAFDMGLAKTGFTEEELSSRGVDYETVVIRARDRAHYYPGGGRFTVKLNWEKRTGRLLGATLVGPGSSVMRINALASAIYGGFTVEDLARQDFAYSPPFSPVWDPVLVAANRALRE